MTEHEQKIDDIITELQSMNETTTDLKETISVKKPQVTKNKKQPKTYLTAKEKQFYKNVSTELLSETSTIIEQQIDTIRVMDKIKNVFTGTIDTVKSFASKALNKVTSFFHMPQGPMEWFNKILSFVLLIEGLFILFKTNIGEKIRKGLSTIKDTLWGSIQYLADNVSLPDALTNAMKAKDGIWEKVQVVFDKVKEYYLKFKTHLSKFTSTISSIFSKIFGGALDITGLFFSLGWKLFRMIELNIIGYFWDSVKYFGLSVLESVYGGYSEKDKGTPPRNSKSGKIPPAEINAQARKAMQRGNRKEAVDIIQSSTEDVGQTQILDAFDKITLHKLSPELREEFTSHSNGGTHFNVSSYQTFTKQYKYSEHRGDKFIIELSENLNKSLLKGQILTFDEFKKQLPNFFYYTSNKSVVEEGIKEMYEGYKKMAEANKAKRNITGYSTDGKIEDEANAVLSQYTINSQVRQFITDSEVDIYQGNYNAGTVVDRELEALSQGKLSLKKYLEDTILYFINPDNWLFIQDAMILSLNENYTKFISETTLGDSMSTKSFLGEDKNTKVNNIRAVSPSGRNELAAACRTVESTEEKLEYELIRQKFLLDNLKQYYKQFRDEFIKVV